MKPLRILIMDDEIYRADGNPSIRAEERLKEVGHLVETTDKMSDVLKSIKARYFDIYVLDVDMSFVEDVIDYKNNSGTTIGKVLRERNSFYNIIIFSAKGRVSDWFSAANHHFQGYIYKAGDGKVGGVDKLVTHIKELSSVKFDHILSMDQPRYENKALIYYHPKTPVEKISLDNIKNILNEVLPKAEVDVCTKLSAVKDKINSNYAVVLLFHAMFQDSSETLKNITEIFLQQPFPHIIVGVDSSFGDKGEEANRNNILNLVNAHPFKMLDLHQPAAENELKQMIVSALQWYGKHEIFEYPNELQEYYGYPLTDDDLEAIKGAEDYYDDFEDENIEEDIEK